MENNISIKLPIIIPKVYKIDMENCYYIMDKIKPIKIENYENILQLVFNYDLDYFENRNIGILVGINKFKQILKYLRFLNIDEFIENIVILIAKSFAYIHYICNYDAYDIEFIFGKSSITDEYCIGIIDFDKFSKIYFEFPYILKRKIAERQYDTIHITNDKELSKILASSLGYLPVSYDKHLFLLFAKTYILSSNKSSLAYEVIKNYFGFTWNDRINYFKDDNFVDEYDLNIITELDKIIHL